MATKHSSASETLRNHSAVLIAYTQNLREAAALALQKSGVCREMGQKARTLADARHISAKSARQRQDAR